jgi:pimeloyl-ACP methyl ester carboxylesterase
MTLPEPFSATVHAFTSPTLHLCAYERGKTLSHNALVFIGGLTSGPHTTPALDTIFQVLDDAKLDYSIWEFRMRSSFTGFGYSSLANDVEDIAALVKYLRELGKAKIVLFGSSTGMNVSDICKL